MSSTPLDNTSVSNKIARMVKRHRLTLPVLLCLCWLLLGGEPPSAHAHPADMYMQTYELRLTPAGAEITYTLSPGPILAAATWHEADLNGNNSVEEEEAAAWLEATFASWQSSLAGTDLVWETTAVSWPTDFDAFMLGDVIISATRTAKFPENTATPAEMTFNNSYADSISLNWFYIYGREGISFTRPSQEKGRLALNLTWDVAEKAAPLTYWDSGTPTLDVGSPVPVLTPEATIEASVDGVAEPEPAALPDIRPYARLTDLVRQQEYSSIFFADGVGCLPGAGRHAWRDSRSWQGIGRRLPRRVTWHA